MSDKDNNIFDLEGDALDEALMAAIEETDEEERLARELKAQENQERAEQARITAIEQEERKAKIDNLRKSLPNEGRRYFFMVEEAQCDEAKKEAYVTGLVYGNCKKNDDVFLFRNDGRALATRILAIEEFNGQVFEPVEEVSQKKARLTIVIDYEKTGFTKENAVPKYSVVTTVRPPVKGADGKTAIENPSLSGLMFRYPEFNKDKEYLNHLTDNIVNGRFLIPAMNAGDGSDASGKKKLQLIMFTKKEDPNKRILPLFTDLQALYLWRKIFEGDQKPTVVVMNFLEAAKFIEKDGFDIAINPSGPVSVGLPSKAAQSIAEIARKHIAGGNVNKEVINDGSKVVVGEPKSSDETADIKDAISAFCSGNPDIKKAGLLYLIRNGQISYLIILDAPKSSQQEVFSGVLNAVRPHLKSIKKVDMSLLSEAPFANDYYSRKPWDYKRV